MAPEGGGVRASSQPHLCCSREGFLQDAMALSLSSAHSEPESLRVTEVATCARHPTLPPPALPGWIHGSWRHLLKGLQIAKGKGEAPPALAGDGGAHPRCLLLSTVVSITQGCGHCWARQEGEGGGP